MSEHDEASERELSKLGETQKKARPTGPMRDMMVVFPSPGGP